MYPPIEPYRHGWLDVGGGHEIYWEECGRPEGIAVVILHGGPGSGCTPNNRRYYDPGRYRVVLFDQRNCGRSRPHASVPDVDLSANTTWHLVDDIERLRNYFSIETWLVQGASWGSTLALAYAQAHPNRVTGLILPAATTGRRSDTDLLTIGLGKMFPTAWAELTRFANRPSESESCTTFLSLGRGQVSKIPSRGRTSEAKSGRVSDRGDEPLLDKMHRLLFSPDPDTRFEAAQRWCDWEMAILPTATAPFPRYADPDFRLAFARLVTHYWRNRCFLEEGAILANTDRIVHLPGIIIQGRLDLGNLSGTPWELAAKIPNVKLVFAEDAGHEGGPSPSEILLNYTVSWRP